MRAKPERYARIIKTVAHRYGVKPEEVIGPSRKAHVSECRQVCAAFLRGDTDLTIAEVGAYLRRSRSAANHLIKRGMWVMGIKAMPEEEQA